MLPVAQDLYQVPRDFERVTRRRFAMFAPLLCALTTVPCQEPRPIPADVVDEVARCERVGRELYISDSVASRGTDALMAKLGSLDDRGLGGYLAVHDLTPKGKPAESWTVLFMSDTEPVHVVYRVQVGPGKAHPKVLEAPGALTLPEEIRPLWAARALAIEKGGPYGQPINPVVLRGKDVGDEGLLVYLLAGTNEADVAVLGRHVRVPTDDQG